MSGPPLGPAISRRRALEVLGALALADLAPAAAAQPAAPQPAAPVAGGGEGPDLGNLFPTLDWVRERGGPSLSFLDARWASLAEWKEAARAEVMRSLAFDPAPGAVTGAVTRVEERAGLRVEHVEIRTGAAPYVMPARVLVPGGRRGRLPGVVALHCHGGEYHFGIGKLVSSPDDPPSLLEYRERLYGRPYAEELARRGFVVLVVDAFYFGERRLRVDSLDPQTAPTEAREWTRQLAALPAGAPERHRAENRVAGAYEAVTAKTLLAAGASWPGLLAWDDRRSLDYLCARPEVDAVRVGCLGLSLGGLRAARLAAADPRIRAACVTGWMTEMGELLAGHARRHTWMAYAPGMYRALDLPDEASLLAPGALLVQQCERDSLFPPAGMRGAVEKLRRIFTRAGVPERFHGAFHDEPHSFTPRMQEEAFAWLERWL